MPKFVFGVKVFPEFDSYEANGSSSDESDA